MTGALLATTGSTSAFTPVLRTFFSGTSTDTVPAGATQARIRIVAGGGAGQGGNGFDTFGAGGGGGGAREFTIAVTGGNTISYSVGAAGVNTTASGTVSGGSFSMTASAGSNTTPGGAGSGNGTGTGGDFGEPFGGSGGPGPSGATLNSWTEILNRGDGGTGQIFAATTPGVGGAISIRYT